MKTNRAFTLIEMLVVIAIIATLVAIIFPSLSSVLEKGKVTQDMNNLRQIGLATQMYLNDNDGAFFQPSGGPTPWTQLLHPKYLANWKIFQSPFDKRTPSETDASAPVSYGFNANAKSGGSSLLADTIAAPSVFVLFAPAQDAGATVKFSATGTTGPTVLKAGNASGGTHNRRLRIDACMADLHVENMSWITFTATDPSTDKCALARWDPAQSCQ